MGVGLPDGKERIAEPAKSSGLGLQVYFSISKGSQQAYAGRLALVSLDVIHFQPIPSSCNSTMAAST